MLPSTLPPSSGMQMRSGTATPTGTATTVFTVAHGLGTTPAWCGVSPGNVLSGALFYIAWDATNITITYLTALTGTLSLRWVAIA